MQNRQEYNKEYWENNVKRLTEKNKEYRQNNKETISKQRKAKYKINASEIKEQRKEYYKNNTEIIKARVEKYRANNPDKVKECDKNYKQNNPEKVKEKYRKAELNRKPSLSRCLSKRISHLIRHSLKDGKDGYHWEILVGFTLQNLKIHLEGKFKDGMNWGNISDWHIDHIIPKSLFEFNSHADREFKQCWALCNLQPLWAFDNLSKGNRIEGSNLSKGIKINKCKGDRRVND